MVTSVPSEPTGTSTCDFLITSRGNVRCVLVLFAFFFELTVRVEASGIVAIVLRIGPACLAR
jgi:hypothetical protein